MLGSIRLHVFTIYLYLLCISIQVARPQFQVEKSIHSNNSSVCDKEYYNGIK